MGSTSDWDVMSDAAATLAQFGVEFEKRVVSAHRTPDLLVEYAKTAKVARTGGNHRRSRRRCAPARHGGQYDRTSGDRCAGQISSLNGLDSLLSIVQMPGGVPVATVAINGAKNAA